MRRVERETFSEERKGRVVIPCGTEIRCMKSIKEAQSEFFDEVRVRCSKAKGTSIFQLFSCEPGDEAMR